MKRVALLAPLMVLLTGCTAPTIYSWGQYEDLIYTSYTKPGKVSPEMQIEKLEADYQKARANNKRMHPGFHAHLGYMYVQLGKLDQARQQFQTEKAEFPESAVLMDRMLANLSKL
jgi:hypothetical protein